MLIGRGILFFLKNHRPGGVNTMVGAGLATVTLVDSGSNLPRPTATRLAEYWWDGATEPWYGDCGALKVGDYIYAYGHAQAAPYVYVCRVKCECATDLSQYEYWNGPTWQTDRLYNPGEKEGVWWQINQGQICWSPFYNCFIFVYVGKDPRVLRPTMPLRTRLMSFIDSWMNSKVLAMVSDCPTGPWSDPIELYQATPLSNGGCIYAAAPHPYYDESCCTLIVTFTNMPNDIQAIKVVRDDQYQSIQYIK